MSDLTPEERRIPWAERERWASLTWKELTLAERDGASKSARRATEVRYGSEPVEDPVSWVNGQHVCEWRRKVAFNLVLELERIAEFRRHERERAREAQEVVSNDR